MGIKMNKFEFVDKINPLWSQMAKSEKNNKKNGGDPEGCRGRNIGLGISVLFLTI